MAYLSLRTIEERRAKFHVRNPVITGPHNPQENNNENVPHRACRFVGPPTLQAQEAKQATTASKDGDRRWSLLLAQTEEVSMCHHAIVAAHYEAKYIAMGQNPVYRYILDSGTSGRVAIYPDPDRCKYQMTYFLVQFNDGSTGADLRKSFSEKTGLSAQELMMDTRFLEMVVTKRMLEPDRLADDPDAHISGDPWVYKLK
jgi:hypothetical protein